MLTHPMAERLRGLGMTAMADAFLEMQTNSAATDLPVRIGSACCSTAK